MILYTVKNGTYIDYKQSLREQPEGRRNVYVNLTNRCNCACTFCLRQTKEMLEGNSLWLEREPELAEVVAAFAAFDLADMKEVIFCGFGEPTLRLEVLLETARYLKQRAPELPIRVNTNGLADLAYQRKIAPLFQGLVDRISISLNASDAENYQRITRNPYGTASYEAMLRFAQDCQRYVPEVMLTVVDCVGAVEIAACRKVCEAVGIQLRVRPFEQ